MKRHRILILAPDLPYPIRAGGNMRMGSIIQGLSMTSDIHIACVASEVFRETYDWVASIGGTIAHISPTPLSKRKLWLQRIKAIITRCNLVHNDRENRFFKSQFEMFDPDLVWLETPYLLRYAIGWRNQVPIVVDFWGTSEGQERDYRHAQGFYKLWQWLRWQTFRGSELKYSHLGNDIITVTPLLLLLCRSIIPPWADMIFFAIDKPRPA